ncbi:unnamed protein product [Ixodes pacificus]
MATLSQGNSNFAYHQFAKDVVKPAPTAAAAENACSEQPQCPTSDKMTTESVTEVPADSTGDDSAADSAPVIDIVINNVVCSFSVRCHLNLRQIALTATNVEYRRENGMLTMKIRAPYTTASMWSSGKVTCTGATRWAIEAVVSMQTWDVKHAACHSLGCGPQATRCEPLFPCLRSQK